MVKGLQLGLALFAVVALIVAFLNPSITGLVTAQAHTIDDHVRKFYGIHSIAFPDGPCGEVAQGLYESIAFIPTDEFEGFETEGEHKIATHNYVLDRVRHIGTIDLISGDPSILHGLNSYLSINSEAIVRMPKINRETFFQLNVYGLRDDHFEVLEGSFAIPSMDCEFNVVNNKANCTCETHALRDLGLAGIPAAITIVERTGKRWDEQDYATLVEQ